jgi:uncharacterized membrane protein YheB (UPF0754 family)
MFDAALLSRAVASFLAARLGDRDWDALSVPCGVMLTGFWRNLNASICLETKDALCGYILNALLAALAYNFDPLMRTIDVQVVVEREINAMHPKGIETLFYKFAGTYFKKLTWYGWIGVFGGIISYVVSFLLLLYAAS